MNTASLSRSSVLGLPGLGSLGGLAAVGLGAAALGGGGGLGGLLGGLGPIFRIAAPVAGGYLGWTKGADLLQRTSVGQAMVGWLANSPVGGLLGSNPYRPVGGALGALAGYAASRFLIS